MHICTCACAHTHTHIAIKENFDKFYYIKFTTSVHKGHHSENKWQATEWKKIFVVHMAKGSHPKNVGNC